MNEDEQRVQKNLINLVKYLPEHVQIWNNILKEIERPLQVLYNQSEQLIHVDSVHIKWIQNFEEIQHCLSHSISSQINDTILELKTAIKHLKQANNDLKNKINNFERSSLDLNLNSTSTIIKGTALQPSLKNLLKSSLSFLTFFQNIGVNIERAVKELDVKNLATVKVLKDAFTINLTDSQVTYLIAITQYICNEKNLN